MYIFKIARYIIHVLFDWLGFYFLSYITIVWLYWFSSNLELYAHSFITTVTSYHYL